MTDTVARQKPALARPGLLIGIILTAAFVMTLSETFMTVALHRLSLDLAVSAATVQLLTSAFLLTMAVIIPTTGLLLTRFTARHIFLAATTAFSLGTALCGLAPGFTVLLIGRIVQASGVAMITPLTMTTVMRLVPTNRRGATLGLVSLVNSFAVAIGPTLGSVVLSTLGWRAMFWVLLPFALIALIIGLLRMHVPSDTSTTPIDVISVALSAIGFSGVLYGLSSAGDTTSTLPPALPWILVTTGLGALALFGWRQHRLQRDDRALLDLRTFSHRGFTTALLLAAIMYVYLIGLSGVLLPLFLQTVLHTSILTSGLAVLPGGIVLGLLGRANGGLYDRVGARPLAISGATALTIALWLFVTLTPHSPLLAVIGIHILMMAALSMMMSPLITASLAALPPHLYSHGSATLNTLQQVAGALGTTLFITIATTASLNHANAPDTTGTRTAFIAAASLGLLILASSFLIRRKPTSA